MMINSETIFSMTQANQNFSQVARSVDQNGKAVIFKQQAKIYRDGSANGGHHAGTDR